MSAIIKYIMCSLSGHLRKLPELFPSISMRIFLHGMSASISGEISPAKGADIPCRNDPRLSMRIFLHGMSASISGEISPAKGADYLWGYFCTECMQQSAGKFPQRRVRIFRAEITPDNVSMRIFLHCDKISAGCTCMGRFLWLIFPYKGPLRHSSRYFRTDISIQNCT